MGDCAADAVSGGRAMTDAPASPQPCELTLQRLLRDVPLSDFFARYWGRAPLRVERREPLFYDRLFSLRDMDALLFAGRFRPGEYRIAESAEGIDLQFADMDDPNRSPPLTDFMRAYDQGKSIVVHGLHRRWPAMAVVTRELERACACPVTTNVYLTPPNSQAYPQHFDTHDFFIFQLNGTKRWKLFDKGNRIDPIRDLSTMRDKAMGPGPAWRPGPLLDEFDLHAGDLLYVPRGFGHEVINQGEASLHLTVGVHGVTWMGMLNFALADAALGSEALRSTIPVLPGPDGTGTLDLRAPPECAAALDLDSALKLWRGLQRSGVEPVPDGYWATLEQLPGLDDATIVQRRIGLTGLVEHDGDDAVMRFLQESVRRPGAHFAALAFAAAEMRFAVHALPGLDAAERLALARELVRKGFLTILPDRALTQHAPQPAAQPCHSQGERHVNQGLEHGDAAIAPMSEARVSVAPAAGGSGGCATCSGQSEAPLSNVYAIGRVSARFPSLDVEKELSQVIRSSETVNLTDRGVLHHLLSQHDNAYIAREMCWVFSVAGTETFTIVPRSGSELAELVAALAQGSGGGETSVLIGTRAPQGLGSATCSGLTLPAVVAHKIYSFSAEVLVKALPLAENQIDAGAELLDRITNLIDNVGDMDEHRAVNYLAMRYPAIYTLVADNFARDFGLQGVATHPVATRSPRKLIDVTLRFASRKSDASELQAARVDVTGIYPFLVTPFHSVFERDS
jgi:Cupin superfamily protein/PatG C-terminal